MQNTDDTNTPEGTNDSASSMSHVPNPMNDSPNPMNDSPEPMSARIIDFVLRNRLFVLGFVATIIGVGLYSLKDIPIDAFPDVTNNQVQVITEATSLSPLEVERLVTFPIENAMNGIPNVMEVRSISKYGLSVVTVVFEDCLLYTSPSPRDVEESRMPSSA